MRLPRLCCTGLKPFKFDILFLPRALLIRQVQKMKCDYDCSSILTGTSAVVSCCSSSPGLALLFPLCLVAMRYCHSVTKENVCLTSFCTCFLFFCIHGFCGYHLSFSGTESASAPSDSQSQIYAPGSELVERAVEGEARRSWKVELHTHLDGSLLPDTLWDIAVARGMQNRFPKDVGSPEDLRKYMMARGRGLDAFLATF